MNSLANNPLISVVIPSYKHAHLIGRALQSVLNQSYKNWEMIIVDNHSPDNTDQVVQAFADPRIKMLKIHNNGVIAASRNMGIREARGEWIAFLDSDDWWTANKLQRCVETINASVDFIYHDLDIVRDKASLFGMRKIKSWQLKTPVLNDLLANGNPIANSSAVVRRQVLLKIGLLSEEVETIAAEDYYGWLKIAQLQKTFVYINETLGSYYLHGNGVSRKDMSIPIRRVLSEFMYLLNEEQTVMVESRLKYTSGRYSFISGDYDVAREKLIFALRKGECHIKMRAVAMLVRLMW